MLIAALALTIQAADPSGAAALANRSALGRSHATVTGERLADLESSEAKAMEADSREATRLIESAALCEQIEEAAHDLEQSDWIVAAWRADNVATARDPGEHETINNRAESVSATLAQAQEALKGAQTLLCGPTRP